MPHIHISAISGRSEELKMKISKALMNALMESADVSQDVCYVTFEDVERKDWPQHDEQNISGKKDVLYIYKGNEVK